MASAWLCTLDLASATPPHSRRPAQTTRNEPFKQLFYAVVGRGLVAAGIWSTTMRAKDLANAATWGRRMRQREHRRISVAHIDGLFPTTSCRLVSNLKQAERFLAGLQLRTSQDRLTAARICLNAPISISSNSFRATLRLLLCHEGHLLSLQRTCKLQDRLCAQLMLGYHGPFAPLARAVFFLDDVYTVRRD